MAEPHSDTTSDGLELTERQREVLGLIALGLTAHEIGEELGISGRTVRAHTEVLRRKLGAPRSRHVARAYWRRTGINPLDLGRSGR